MRARSLALATALIAVTASGAQATLTPTATDFVVYGADSVNEDITASAHARNELDDKYLTVWAGESAGTGEYDIVAGIVDATTGAGEVFIGSISELGGDARSPAAAFDPVTKRYAVAWMQEVDAPGAWEICVRLVSREGAPIGNTLVVSSAGSIPSDTAFDAMHPDIAADGEGAFLVAWTQDDDDGSRVNGEFDLHGRRVAAAGGTLGSAFPITTFATGTEYDALAPRVAWFPDIAQYVVAYERDVAVGPTHAGAIYFTLILQDGSPGAFKTTAGNVGRPVGGDLAKRVSYSSKNPDIAFDRRSRRMLVVWDDNPDLRPVSSQIYGGIIEQNLSSFVLPAPLSITSSGSDVVCLARNPVVTYSSFSANWVVAWSGSSSVSGSCPSDRQIMLREIDSDGNALGTEPLLASPGGAAGEAVRPAIIASSASHLNLFVTWCGEPSTPDRFDLMGSFYQLDQGTDAPAAVVPTRLAIGAAPNPFNPVTRVRFDLPQAGRATVKIFDLRGSLVRILADAEFMAGRQEMVWDGSDSRGAQVSSGVYMMRLEHALGVKTSKIALIK